MSRSLIGVDLASQSLESTNLIAIAKNLRPARKEGQRRATLACFVPIKNRVDQAEGDTLGGATPDVSCDASSRINPWALADYCLLNVNRTSWRYHCSKRRFARLIRSESEMAGSNNSIPGSIESSSNCS
jgi:hypothetical protein